MIPCYKYNVLAQERFLFVSLMIESDVSFAVRGILNIELIDILTQDWSDVGF
jgi:hypothetical protein